MNKIVNLCLLVLMFGTSTQASEDGGKQDTRKQRLQEQKENPEAKNARDRKQINDRRDPQGHRAKK
jgi:hypothetical protein